MRLRRTGFEPEIAVEKAASTHRENLDIFLSAMFDRQRSMSGRLTPSSRMDRYREHIEDVAMSGIKSFA